MNASLAEIGAGLLVVFGVLYFLGVFTTIRAACAFVGICLVAGAATGSLGFDLVIRCVAWVESLISDLTHDLIHVRIGALVLLLVCGLIFLHDMHPKQGARKRTGWAGIALGLVMIVGVAQIPAVNHVPADVRSGVTNVQHSAGGR
jgi:hypothetical protein